MIKILEGKKAGKKMKKLENLLKYFNEDDQVLLGDGISINYVEKEFYLSTYWCNKKILLDTVKLLLRDCIK